MEGFLEEVEMTDDGQGETRTWWEVLVDLEKMFRKETENQEEQEAVVE